MAGTGRPGSGPGERTRRALRVVAMLLAVVVTILAATAEAGWAAPVRGVAGAPASDAPGTGAHRTGPPGAAGTGAAGVEAAPLGGGRPGDGGRPGGKVRPGHGARPDHGARPGDEPMPPPARPPGAGRRAPGALYAWPLDPVPVVLTPFRRPTFRFGPGHRGADLRGTAGQTVVTAREGVVVFAGPVAGRPVVSVDHPDGLRTTYLPVVPSVRVGDRVATGDPIGTLGTGHAGCAGAVCLHWGVRRGQYDYLDPLVLVRPPRLRLLPIGVAGGG